jgi:hypothetical protein
LAEIAGRFSRNGSDEVFDPPNVRSQDRISWRRNEMRTALAGRKAVLRVRLFRTNSTDLRIFQASVHLCTQPPRTGVGRPRNDREAARRSIVISFCVHIGGLKDCASTLCNEEPWAHSLPILPIVCCVLEISLMHLSRFLHGIRSDQSVQNGVKFFSQIFFRCHCAHGNNGLTRRSRKSFI